MWNSFNTYDLSPEQAFETLNNQLFEKYLHTQYKEKLLKFRVINGSGGDGGIEAYGELADKSIIAIQSKWFLNNLEASQIRQIEKSVRTAIELRPRISNYVICIPRNINSVKIGKGKKPILNTEEFRINKLVKDLLKDYPDLHIICWFEHEITMQLLLPQNEGVHKYWFEKQIFFFNSLEQRFETQKTNSWLRERYVPSLNGSGIIRDQIGRQLFDSGFRQIVLLTVNKLKHEISSFEGLLKPLLTHSQKRSFLPNLNRLNETVQSLKLSLDQIKLDLTYAIETSSMMSEPEFSIHDVIDELRFELRGTTPTNLEKPYFKNFVLQLDVFETNLLQDFYKIYSVLSIEKCVLILGRAGTGKTHGLAYSVEHFLNEGYPALLIRAYGADSSSWGALLANELELYDWKLNEIFSALETLAYRNDVKRAHKLNGDGEQNFISSKVLVCIDGLEEDIAHWDTWYDRIAEASEIVKKFPRVRILFSARNNFFNNDKIIDSKDLALVELPREGDIAITDVLEIYLEAYKIDVENIRFINGLDNLFALRLFCEQYQNAKITEDSDVQTATGVLLNLKLKRLNNELLKLFRKQSLEVTPVVDTLLLLSEQFYRTPELSHEQIRKVIDNELLKYLSSLEIEQLLQFFSENGIITRAEREEGSGILRKRNKFYTISYQSILEIVLSDNITNQIINDGAKEFPEIIFRNFALPYDVNPIEFRRAHNGKTPNQQLIQNVVNRVLIRTGKLIGIDGYLSKGFDSKQIFKMQLEALTAVPNKIASLFKDWIDDMIYIDYHKRFEIIRSLIYPLANRPGHIFNAMYLHNILIEFPDSFSRDKFWSGLDDHEKRINGHANAWSLSAIFNSYLELSEYEKFDGRPLLYAWGLTTLDQKLREDIRIKLTKWALLVPDEFLKLLDLLFNCNDPQLQEDLSSIMLGFSTRCRDKLSIARLSLWTLDNVFNKKDVYRNVIVRYGFKAIIERSYQLKLVSRKELLIARPSKLDVLELLPLDIHYLKKPTEEYYPIAHDLAWYVIKDAFDNFLTYEVGYGKDGTTKETTSFLNKYKEKHNNEYVLNPRSWAMAAALMYIRSLGFDRVKGNSFTSASHGSKSELFTYEEKYVWLAVNYLKGYLSDYLPFDDFGEKFWIKDYSSITEIHNPGDDFENMLENQIDEQFNPKPWIIKEILAPEIMSNGNLTKIIEEAVNTEHHIEFENWIFFDKSDFQFLQEGKKATTLYNYTGLYNSSNTIHSSIEIHCCTIEKKHFEVFKEELFRSFNKDVLNNDLRFYTRPQTDTYTNPSDIIWMDWIGEDGKTEHFMDEITFSPTIAKVVKRSVKGEEEVYIPAKATRKAIQIKGLEDNNYLGKSGEVLGINYKIKTDVFGESQDMVVVDDFLYNASLSKKGRLRFWFALTISNKNPLNTDIDSIPYIQKVRKYLLWEENGRVNSFKFWDGRYSNKL